MINSKAPGPFDTSAKSEFILRHVNKTPVEIVKLAKREGINLTATYVRSIQWVLRTSMRALVAAELEPESETASSANRLREVLRAEMNKHSVMPESAPVSMPSALPHAATLPALRHPTPPQAAKPGQMWESMFVETAKRIGISRALELLAEMEES